MEMEKEGDVKELMVRSIVHRTPSLTKACIQDKSIRKNVYRLKGNVPAANFIEIPKLLSAPSHGLGLTGKFIYFQIKPMGSRAFSIHLDALTDRKSPIRFSLSNMFSETKSHGSVLKLPLE